MINLYDSEIIEVGQLTAYLTKKYAHRANTMTVLEEFRNEAIARFADIGFEVTVDVTPSFVSKPPTITIADRIVPLEYGYDVEKKTWEVVKSKERKQTVLDEDKVDGDPDLESLL